MHKIASGSLTQETYYITQNKQSKHTYQHEKEIRENSTLDSKNRDSLFHYSRNNWAAMTNRIERQTEAFREALKICRSYALDWKRHIYPKIKEGEIVAYHVIDETLSTPIETIYL